MMYAIDGLPGGRSPGSSYRRGGTIATRGRRFDTRAAAGLSEATTPSLADPSRGHADSLPVARFLRSAPERDARCPGALQPAGLLRYHLHRPRARRRRGGAVRGHAGVRGLRLRRGARGRGRRARFRPRGTALRLARDAGHDPRARRHRRRPQHQHADALRRSAPGALRRPGRSRQALSLRREHPGVLRPVGGARLRLPRRFRAPFARGHGEEERHMSYLATTDFTEDRAFLDGFERRLHGDLDLSWLDAPRERARCRPQNERRGLTFRDLDVGSYGWSEMPEVIRQNRSFAPRGAEQPEGLP